MLHDQAKIDTVYRTAQIKEHELSHAVALFSPLLY